MLTSKQRAFLKGLANGIDPVLIVGKDGISSNQISELSALLEAREIVKVQVLETAPYDAAFACAETASRIGGCEPVQVIGRRFVLYRQSIENKRIDLKNLRIIEKKKDPAKSAKPAKTARRSSFGRRGGERGHSSRSRRGVYN